MHIVHARLRIVGTQIKYSLVRGTADYEGLHNKLTTLPGVARVHASFALRTVFKKSKIEV